MEYKWKNNVIFSERNDLSKFLSDYYQSNPQRKIIYLLGKGFDRECKLNCVKLQ